MNNDNEMFTLQDEYYNLHNRIITNGQTASLCLIKVCKDLKLMKEKELYKATGIDSFERYTSEVLGIKKSQAYKYISLADKFSSDFFQLNGKIGITKLEILSKLDEEEAAKLLTEIDIVDTTVADLKSHVFNLEIKLEQKNIELDDFKNLKEALDFKEQKIKQLTSLIDEQTSSANTASENIQNEELSKELIDLKKEYAKLEKKYKSEKAIVKESVIVEKLVVDETKGKELEESFKEKEKAFKEDEKRFEQKINSLEKEKEEVLSKYEKEIKKNHIEADSDLILIKILFEDTQEKLSLLVSKITSYQKSDNRSKLVEMLRTLLNNYLGVSNCE